MDDLNGDIITDFSTSDALKVTGTDLSALNGTAAGATLTLAAGKTLTLTGITSAYNWQASYSGGDTTLTLVTPPATTTSSGSDSGGSSTSVVDGMLVSKTSSTDSRGVPMITISIPVVSDKRQDSNATSSNADVPLATDQMGRPAIQVSLPIGTGLNASGIERPVVKTLAVDTLLQAIQATTTNSTDWTQQTGFGQSFFGALPSDAPALVQTMTPLVSGTIAPSQSIILTGDSSLSGSSGSRKALVVDGRSLPSGTPVDLMGVDFAAVQGALTVNTHHSTSGAALKVPAGAAAAVANVADTAQTIVCDSAAQKVTLGDMADVLQAGSGADTGIGGSGADTLGAGDGGDLLYGNTGSDVLYGNVGADTLYGGRDADSLYGGRDEDVLSGNLGDDALCGNLGNDLLNGNTGNDLVTGNAGNDTVRGGQGADTVRGGIGNDLVYGDLGDDQLWGDLGADTLTGGAGADVFAFRSGDGADVVSDFRFAEGDRIGLAGGLSGYTLRSNGAGDAVIVFSDTDTVTLTGVRASDIDAGWFVTMTGR